MNPLPLSAALHRYVVPWLQLDWPLDWGRLFDASQPLVLEIGFGNGAFLLEQARAHPEYNYVGIERAWRSVHRLIKRLKQTPVANVRVLEGDAPWQLQRLFPPNALFEVFINFSDPWPKEHHHPRRLVQDHFVRLLGERLLPNGQVTIATDHTEYAAWICNVLQRQSILQPRYEPPFVHHLPNRRPTKYEAKALEQGRTIHYFVWHKAQTVEDPFVQIEKVDSMPNVTLQGFAAIEELLATLTPQTWQENHRNVETLIKLDEIFSALDHAGGLIKVLVREGNLSQQIGISIYVQPEGTVLIKPSSFGYPRPTWGVKRAVWHIANVLLNGHEQLSVASSTVGRF